MSGSRRLVAAICAIMTFIIPIGHAQSPAELSHVRTLQTLHSLLSSPSWEVRLWASEALGRVARETRQEVSKPEKGAKLAPIQKEGENKMTVLDRLVIPALRRMSKDTGEEPMVRVSALKSLEQIGPRANAAIADLPDLIADPNWLVRQSAAEALGRAAQGASHEAMATVPRVIAQLRHPQYSVRLWGVKSLASIGSGIQDAILKHTNNANMLQEELAKNPGEVAGMEEKRDFLARIPALLGTLRQVLDSINQALDGQLGDPDPWVRESSALALTRTNPHQAIRALSELLKREEHPRVQRNIAEALGSIGERFRGATDEDVRLLKTFAVPALRSLLKAPCPRTREVVVRALGQIGPPALAASTDMEAQLGSDAALSVKEEILQALSAIHGSPASGGPGSTAPAGAGQ